jgi:UDP-glucose 4-epimerase
MSDLDTPIVAVLGGGGFIGAHVVRALEETGARPRVLSGPEQFQITDAEAVGRFVAGAGAVLHLAGPSSVARSFADPVSCIDDHVVGTAVVVEAMARAGIRHIVYVSSAEVYGRPITAAVREDHPLAPRSPYGAAKAGAEAVVGAAHRRGLVCGAIFRPFSVYGAGMTPSSLVASIVAQARETTEIEVNDLEPVRDYCFARDAAAALAQACLQRCDDLKTLNLCTGVATDVASVVDALGSAMGVRLQARERIGQKRGEAEIYRLVGDPRAVREAFDWEPHFSLEAGFAEMLKDAVAS